MYWFLFMFSLFCNELSEVDVLLINPQFSAGRV